jgi:hypothetical protein
VDAGAIDTAIFGHTIRALIGITAAKQIYAISRVIKWEPYYGSDVVFVIDHVSYDTTGVQR